MKNLCSWLPVASTLLIFSVSAQYKPDIEFSGFGRVIAGQLDDNKSQYDGYTNTLDLEQESLLGLQIDTQLTSKLSATGQLLIHSANYRESGLEWAYVTYQPTKELDLKIGKMRTPFLSFSAVMDVGFSYPWISPPTEVYIPYLFSTFEGVQASYNTVKGDQAYYFSGYWGSYDDPIYLGNVLVDGKVNDLRGIVASVTQNNISFRLSYHNSDVDVFQQEVELIKSALRQQGFLQSIESFRSEGAVSAYQAGISYDDLDYFARAEWISIDTEFGAMPKSKSYYVTAGYNLSPYSFHLTYSDRSNEAIYRVDEIPMGHPLRPVYQQMVDSFSGGDTKSITIGTRWNIKTNIAIKLDISALDGQLFLENPEPGSFRTDTHATLTRMGVEWIF